MMAPLGVNGTPTVVNQVGLIDKSVAGLGV